ncbi:MAG: preprotein translocase subunit YajC [bacterium]|nr:preprotein translocase subunit YajC [bacterium]
MLVAIAYAAEGAGPAQQSPFGAFVPLILIFAIFYFLLIRPQQKKAKEHTNSLETMKTGDEVITNGGIFGKVSKIDNDKVVVEIADKVKVIVAKSQLHPLKSVEK